MRIIYTAFAILVLFAVSCTDRPRDNIFDPASGIGNIDIGLRAIAEETSIRLVWNATGEVQYDSIIIYRKWPGSTQYNALTIVPSNQYAYRDNVSLTDRAYSYYLTLVGEDGESPPTEAVEATPGPGDIWLLDRWNFEALNLTYDLKTTRAIKYGVWSPENLVIVREERLALMTYPSYGFFELFNPELPYERLFGSSALSDPYDCAFDPVFKYFWITDSSGSLHRLNTATNMLTTVPGNFGKPTTVRISSNDMVYILDRTEKAIYTYSRSGVYNGVLNLRGNHQLNNPKNFEINQKTGDLFLIDETAGGDILYIYNQQYDSLRVLEEQPLIHTLAVDEKRQSIWIIVRIDLNSVIMQLSPDGVRLKMLEEFEKPIDLAINPHNGNIIVIDAATATVTHIREDASVIGSYTNAAQPYKVLIE